MSPKRPALATGVLALSTAAWLLADAQTKTAVERTVYFTARDQGGMYVAGLTTADLTVKDGGRDRHILRVGPSTARLKICLAIDENLSPDVVIRRAAAWFVGQLQGHADVALYLIGHGNVKLVDYSADPRPILNALANLPQRAQGGGNLVESLFELAKTQRSLEGRRALVILAAEIPQRTTVTANGVLDQLRDTGAVLHAVTLVGPAGTAEPMTPEMAHLETNEEVERDRALNDGTKQSGGVRLVSMRVDDFQAALDRIRGELTQQYEMTYAMPPGSNSDGRVSITSKRRGVTVRGPTVVPKI